MIHCDVIRDLLPLYLDDCCSIESRRLVEEHLRECDKCRALMRNMGQELTIEEEVEENLEEEQLLRKSKEVLKKEVKIDYLEKAVKLDIPFNIMLIVFTLYQCIENVKAGVPFKPLEWTYGYSIEETGMYWVFIVILISWIIYEVIFLRENKRGTAGIIPWAVAGLSVLFKIGAIVLCGIIGFFIMYV